jgi:hypothetical protein
VDLGNLLRVLRVHWMLVAVGLVATAVVAVVLVSQVEPEYEARTSVLLLTPPETQTPEGEVLQRNPLENPGGVVVTATALIDVINSPRFVLAMREQGVSNKYEVTINPAGSGALLVARTSAATPDVALTSLTTLIAEMRSSLANIQEQAGIAESTWIRAEVLTVPDEATTLTGSKSRVLLMVFALGGLATVTLAYLADLAYGDRRFLRGRRSRKDSDDVSPYASDLLSDLLDDDGKPTVIEQSAEARPPFSARAG